MITVLTVALAPVQSYPQIYAFDGSGLTEQVLLRRAPPKEHADRSPAPPRRPQSPSSGSSQAPEGARSPSSQALSPSGDSDSSTDGGRSIPRARVRARVIGPAVVQYAADHHDPRRAQLTPGEKQRFTVRGHRRAAINVVLPDRHPPGKVEMMARGRQSADVSVDNKGGGSGSIMHLAPFREAPQAVPPGRWLAKSSEAMGGSSERQKFKANLEGSGRVHGAAFNPVDHTAPQESTGDDQ